MAKIELFSFTSDESFHLPVFPDSARQIEGRGQASAHDQEFLIASGGPFSPVGTVGHCGRIFDRLCQGVLG